MSFTQGLLLISGLVLSSALAAYAYLQLQRQAHAPALALTKARRTQR